MKKINNVIIALVAIIISSNFFACTEDSNEPDKLIDISGYIMIENEKPLVDALVEVLDQDLNIIATDSSDIIGLFTLKNIPSDIAGLDIKVSHIDYSDYMTSLTSFKESIEKGEKILMQLQKNDCCSMIKLTISDKENGDIIDSAKVDLKDGKNIIETRYTSKTGIVIFSSLCANDYNIRIQKSNYKVFEEEFNLGKCDTIEKTIKLLFDKSDDDSCCKGILKVYPRDSETKKALDGAKIKLWKDGKMLEYAKVVNGKAVIDGICEGKYGVDIIAEGYKDIEFEYTHKCNEVKVFEKELVKEKDDTCCTAQMKLLTKDKEASKYISDVKIKLYANDKLIHDGKTNGDGVIIFKNLCAPQRYVIVAEKDGYKEVEFDWTFKECKEFQEHIWMSKK